MYSSETKLTVARKPHICTSCGETINAGDEYCRWQTNVDEKWLTNKMHPECYHMHLKDAEGGHFEYTLYGYERPERETTIPA